MNKMDQSVPSKGFFAAIGAVMGIASSLLIIAYASPVDTPQSLQRQILMVLTWPVWIAYRLELHGMVWSMFCFTLGPGLYVAIWTMLGLWIGCRLKKNRETKCPMG